MVTIDGEPWFVAKDVCDVLGYANSRDAITKLTATNQRQVAMKSNVANSDVSFPNRGLTVVSEGGLYSLIFGSKMPFAQQFKSWVTDVVLPAIRKDGAYIMGEEKVATGENISGVTRFPGKLFLYSSRNAGEAPCLFGTQTQESWSPSTTPSRI